VPFSSWATTNTVVPDRKAPAMNSIIYIVGLVVIVIAILSFLGLR
jgi:hypothetical protein